MQLDRRLCELETAEDIFEMFGLEPDARILTVHRLHILQQFGIAVAQIDAQVPALSDEHRWRRYAAALKHVHDQYAKGTARPAPVFSGATRSLSQLRRKPTDAERRS